VTSDPAVIGANIPAIADPPRRVPLGAKLAVFDQREITASLNWSIPAAVCLLLSAIAQPVRGARLALVMVGAVCLLLAMRRSIPRCFDAMRSIQRMRWGRLTMGRIVSCRFLRKSQAMKPFAMFVKEWDALDARAGFDQMTGCLFGVFAIFIGIPIVSFFAIFFIGVAFKMLRVPGVEGTEELTFAFFAKAVGGTILIVAMFVVVRWIMRLYLLVQFEDMMNEHREPEERLSAVEVLRRELLEEKRKPPPEQRNAFPPESYAWELACKVEYPGSSKVHTAEGRAHFAPRLHRAGVELLLFHPAAPEEVDLLVGLPEQVALGGGEWMPVPVLGHALKLLITAAVFLAGFGALAFEGYSLALR
jgi:hypothetical protein